MLPDADDPPAGLAQKPEHFFIPLHIPRNLLPPECRIALRLGRMPGAPVPETAIHKNRNAIRAKHEIGFAIQRMIPPPAGDFMRMNALHEWDLRVTLMSICSF